MILPSIFEYAADINITNGKNIKTFKLSNNNSLIKWYSFNSDYNYEIINIKKGSIITLTYDLYINYNKYSENINLKDINLFNTLKELSKIRGNTLGLMLQHRYMELVNFNNNNTDFKIIINKKSPTGGI